MGDAVPHVLIVGAGDTGLTLATMLSSAGLRVSTLNRSGRSIDAATALVGDLADSASLVGLPSADVVVFTTAPPSRDDEGYRTKNGERLSARWIAYTPVPDDRASLANFIQSDLKDIGFELVREVLEPAQYMEFYGPRDFDVTDWAFSGPDADVLRSHLQTGGYQTVSTVTKPEVDQWLSDGSPPAVPQLGNRSTSAFSAGTLRKTLSFRSTFPQKSRWPVKRSVVWSLTFTVEHSFTA